MQKDILHAFDFLKKVTVDVKFTIPIVHSSICQRRRFKGYTNNNAHCDAFSSSSEAGSATENAMRIL